MIRTRSTALPSLGLWTLVALLLVTSMLSIAQPVGADVTGGCSGSVDFLMDSAGSYGPSNDTRSNPIVFPKTDGERHLPSSCRSRWRRSELRSNSLHPLRWRSSRALSFLDSSQSPLFWLVWFS